MREEYQVRSGLEPWEIDRERTDEGVTAYGGSLSARAGLVFVLRAGQ